MSPDRGPRVGTPSAKASGINEIDINQRILGFKGIHKKITLLNSHELKQLSA